MLHCGRDRGFRVIWLFCLRIAASRNWSATVAAPLTPRARVEFGAVESGQFKRKQVVAGTHAGTTIGDDAIDAVLTEQRRERRAQFLRRAKAAVGIEVVAKRPAHSTGNVAGYRVDGFVFATKTISAAAVQKQYVRVVQVRQNIVRIDGLIAQAPIECRWFDARNVAANVMTRALPSGKSAVEHRDLAVTKPSQHPPQACRVHAAGVVVGDHLSFFRNAGSRHSCCESHGVGQRVATVAPVLLAGKIAIEMQKLSVRDVRLAIRAFADIRVRQLVPAIENPPRRIIDVRCEPLGGNQRIEIHGRIETQGLPVA